MRRCDTFVEKSRRKRGAPRECVRATDPPRPASHRARPCSTVAALARRRCGYGLRNGARALPEPTAQLALRRVTGHTDDRGSGDELGRCADGTLLFAATQIKLVEHHKDEPTDLRVREDLAQEMSKQKRANPTQSRAAVEFQPEHWTC